MKQISNGFDERYYLYEDGNVYDKLREVIIYPSRRHLFKLKASDGTRINISQKKLYQIVYNSNYCKDNIENITDEQWKEIIDTQGLYLISNKGRVKSLNGYNAIILKAYRNQRGYSRVDIMKNGKRCSILVHRLVAYAFLPFPLCLDYQLHHVDFNKDNNAADNLVWLSPAAHCEVHKRKVQEIDNGKIKSTELEDIESSKSKSG